jgi:ParB family transcriptional regulator, chromosome partitioning protein
MSVSALLLVASFFLPWFICMAVVGVPGRTPQIVVKPIEWFRPDPNQPRKDFDPVALKALGLSMLEHGQLQPAGARPDGTLIWGERRYRAALEVGIKQLQVIITERQMTDAEIRIISLIENTCRADLKPAEKAHALAEIQKLNGWNNKELGQHVQMEPSLVGRYLSLFNCIPSVQAAAQADKIGVSSWYSLSLLGTPEEQQQVLEMHLSGIPRDQIASISRQKRTAPNGAAQKDKVTRVRVDMPTGIQIVISGESINFDQVIEALQAAAKSARSARDQNIDTKGWAAMMKDQARQAAKNKGTGK